MNTEQIANELGAATVLELVELRTTLERVWGVSAAPRIAQVLDDQDHSGCVTPTQIEQTEFSLFLQDPGPNKINTIKVVREITGLGLKESKDLIEGTMPREILSGVSKETIDRHILAFTAAGAKVISK